MQAAELHARSGVVIARRAHRGRRRAQQCSQDSAAAADSDRDGLRLSCCPQRHFWLPGAPPNPLHGSASFFSRYTNKYDCSTGNMGEVWQSVTQTLLTKLPGPGHTTWTALVLQALGAGCTW